MPARWWGSTRRRWPPPTPGCVYERGRPGRASTAWTSCSAPCPTASPSASCPALRDRVGVIVDLAADFRLRDPGLYPAWYGEEHAAPGAAGRGRLRAARAVPRPSWPGPRSSPPPAATRPRPDWPWPRWCGPGWSRPTGIIVDAASGVSGAGRAPSDRTALRHRRRGLRGLRPADPSPHARDRADPGRRCRGALHAASRPHGPGDPGHLLRPARRGAAARSRRPT